MRLSFLFQAQRHSKNLFPRHSQMMVVPSAQIAYKSVENYLNLLLQNAVNDGQVQAFQLHSTSRNNKPKRMIRELATESVEGSTSVSVQVCKSLVDFLSSSRPLHRADQ